MMKKSGTIILSLILGTLFLAGTAVFAQPPHPPGPNPPPGHMSAGPQHGNPDVMRKFMFPPEMIMRHQRQLGLTEEQKDYIKKQVQETQAKFTGLQWDLQDEMGKLTEMAEEERMDEKTAVQQLEKVFALENEIKKTHLILAIRIKNKLTPAQQEKLEELKAQKKWKREARKEWREKRNKSPER